MPKGALPLWTPHPRRREPREQGLRAVGPSLLPPGRASGRSCRVKGPCPRPTGCGPHQPLDPSSARHSGAAWCVLAGVLAGRGVKGGTGGRSPERSAGTGRGCRAKPSPLMPLEAIQPIGQGEEQGEAAGPAPAASPARSDAGCNRRGCPSEARSVLERRKFKVHLLIHSFEL